MVSVLAAGSIERSAAKEGTASRRAKKAVKSFPNFIAGCVQKIWRRGWDLNPRYPLRYVRFRGGSFQPLTHLSAVQAVPAIRYFQRAAGGKTIATAPHNDRPTLPSLLQCGGSMPDDSIPASRNRRLRFWGLWHRKLRAGAGREPWLPRTSGMAQL